MTTPTRADPQTACSTPPKGVLVALRRYRLNDAFRDLMTTARRHNVNPPLTLADALVALAENHGVNALDTDVVAIARHTWGPPLLDQPPRNHQTPPHDDDHPP